MLRHWKCKRHIEVDKELYFKILNTVASNIHTFIRISPFNPKYSWSMLCWLLKPGHFFHIVPIFSPVFETIYSLVKMLNIFKFSDLDLFIFFFVTWNSWLDKQRHGQQGPWIRMVAAPLESHTSKSGVNMLHLSAASQHKHSLNTTTVIWYYSLCKPATSNLAHNGSNFTHWQRSA